MSSGNKASIVSQCAGALQVRTKQAEKDGDEESLVLVAEKLCC